MGATTRPAIRYLTDETAAEVVTEAERMLDEVGVRVEYEPAVELLHGAGARSEQDGRVRIPPELVELALASAPTDFQLYDRDGENPLRIGSGEAHFDPGSAAIKVLDYAQDRARAATEEDCVRFARLTEALPAFAMQSTCVVPSDVPVGSADRHRLGLALLNGRKPIITGTFTEGSFEAMRAMLVCVRGGEEELREKPLAIFDCCPSPPLIWSELTCSALVRCARAGIPAQLISMPMAGATAPVTLFGSAAQHAAENLSGVVIHQLARPGAPIVYGACASAFDMRSGTTPLGAIDTALLNATCAEVGAHLGLPTHAYMALSDSKALDYQAGLESGCGALSAALGCIDVVSGPGMLEFVNCQSLEKLVLDHEACSMALRASRGVERRAGDSPLEVVREGIAEGEFLGLQHTQRWFREELHFPGATIDRLVGDAWEAAGAKTAAQRAHAEVERLLALDGASPPAPEIVAELRRLMA